MKGFFQSWMKCLISMLCVIALSGCGAAYKQSVVNTLGAYQQGQYVAAVQSSQAAVKDSEKHNKHDRLILLLEEGAINRTAGHLDESTIAFDDAEKLFTKFDERAKLQLGAEAYSAVTNQAALDYTGFGYDRIMTNVYKAMNYIEDKRADDARVEIKRIAESQEACEQRYQNEIKKMEKDQKGKGDLQYDAERTRKDPKYINGERQSLAEFDDVQNEEPLDNLSHKRLYDNPFAEYLQGLFYLYSEAGGDKEVGRVALRNAAGMMQQNKFAVYDAQYADQVAAGAANLPPRTYVVFETGLAPARREIRIDLPIFLYNALIHDTRVDYAGIAFPVLQKIGDNHPSLTIQLPNGYYQTEVIADMDKIVAREFKHALPQIMTRAIISAAVKVAASYAAAEATKNADGWAQLIVRGGAVIYGAATNEADTRTWRTLPKQIQIASFTTPADGIVKLTMPNGAPVAEVHCEPGKANLILVRSPSTVAPPVVRTIALN